MSNWANAASLWFRRLVGTSSDSPLPPSGKQTVASGAHAVLAAELLASERVCRPARLGELPRLDATSAAPNAFDRLVHEVVVDGSRAALAAANGLALSGMRSAVLLPEDSLEAIHAGLHTAVARRAPLVVHAVTSADTAGSTTPGAQGHGSYHALANTGALLALARNPQRAIDLSLVARRAAELGLVPAVVAMDGPETAWAPHTVQMPDIDLVRGFLGRPGDLIEAPTVAQAMLLGEKRARVPRWFDADRPAGLSMLQNGQDLAVGLLGQHAFFGEPLRELLDQALDDFEKRTGRRLPLVSRHRLEGAREVFIAEGPAIDAAEAVADYLRAEHKRRVGVLGIEWLRPLAADEIREALADVEVATVLERGGDGMSEAGPLLRELRTALQGDGPRLLSANYGLGGQPLSAANLVALHENMRAGGPRAFAVVGVSFSSSDQPRRQVLEQRVKSAYPELVAAALDVDVPLDLRPDSARTVALWSRRSSLPDRALESLARAAADAVGPQVSSRATAGEHGTWTGQVTASPDPLPGGADVVPVDAVLLSAPDLPASTNPLTRLVRGGKVLVGSALTPEALWTQLPRAWRSAVRERELSVYVADLDVPGLIGQVAWLLGGQAAEVAPVRVDHEELAEVAEPDLGPPLAVRRFGKARPTFDNVPRFWGELVGPRLERAGFDPVPDPYLSLAAVPPSTSVLYEAAAHQDRLPRIDADRCSACGACWSACPDTAIGPSVLGTQALLDAALEIATDPTVERNPAADKLKRAHKQLAARIDGTLKKQEMGSLTEPVLRESFEWLVEQMKLDDDERAKFAEAFDGTLAELGKLPIAVTNALFHEPHAAKKGSGELLALAINPRACQACRGCAAVCPEEAITIGPRSDEAVAEAQAGWNTWEALPDTSGSSIAHAADTEVGPLASVLTSRTALLAVTGGGGHEPGSGPRLGARLVAAVAEYQKQRRVVARLTELRSLSERLHDAVRGAVTEALPTRDLKALEQALDRVPARASNLGALVAGLDELGERATLDSDKARGLLGVARRVDELQRDLVDGADGLGRARYGVVVASPSIASWAAEFPRNPFSAPSVVDLAGDGPDLAIGLAESLLSRHADQIRLLRLAELRLSAPSDMVLKERDLARLSWHELSADELQHCPSVILLAGPDVFTGAAHAGLMRVLTSGLPIKVVVLDGHEQLLAGRDPLLPVLGLRTAYVVSSTVAHRDHLFRGVEAALEYPGPGFVHLYSPSPARHGFATEHTVERARLAADSRLHPLLRYDPAAPGVFGTRLDLEGNPQPGEPWAKTDRGLITPASFALGEARFAPHLLDPQGQTQPSADWALSSPDARATARPVVTTAEGTARALDEPLAAAVLERLDAWRTLQELAGVVTPFTKQVRAEASADVADQHQRELAELRAEYERKLSELEKSQLAEHTERLRQRLLELAGYAKRARGERPS